MKSLTPAAIAPPFARYAPAMRMAWRLRPGSGS